MLVVIGEQILQQHTQRLFQQLLMNLQDGTDDFSTTAGEIELTYDKFKNADSEDINLVIGGSSSIVGDTAAELQDTHVTMLVNLVEGRKDCVAFASPYRSAVVGVTTSSKQNQKMLKLLLT